MASNIKCEENFILEEFHNFNNIDISLDKYKELLDYYKYGYECKGKLYKKCTPILTHNDIGVNNLSLKNNEFTVLDWELAGIGNYYSEVFDVALNVCGFCDSQSDLNCFKFFLEGYYSVYNLKRDKQLFEYAIGDVYYEIIKYMFINFNNEKRTYFLNQFYELKKFENLFLKLLVGKEI